MKDSTWLRVPCLRLQCRWTHRILQSRHLEYKSAAECEEEALIQYVKLQETLQPRAQLRPAIRTTQSRQQLSKRDLRIKRLSLLRERRRYRKPPSKQDGNTKAASNLRGKTTPLQLAGGSNPLGARKAMGSWTNRLLREVEASQFGRQVSLA